MAVSYRAAQNLIKRGDDAALSDALRDGLDANSANENGWTLLMLAAVEGATPLGQLLLQHGADPAKQNGKGQTALGIATSRGNEAFVRLLTDTAG